MTDLRWPATAPCSTCPWRRSSTVGGADIPGFDLQLMRDLACTVGETDDFRPVMACHTSSCGDRERPCVGYLAVEGWSNLRARVEAMAGHFDWPAIREACADLDLWPSFAEMLAAYEAAVEG